MATLSKSRIQQLAVILSILTGLALALFFLLRGLDKHVDLFVTPTDFEPMVLEKGQHLQVGGLVKVGSVQKQPPNNGSNVLLTRFQITDNSNKTIDVTFDKVLPDLFQEDKGVIAKGVWMGDHVKANIVLAKHDENYVAPAIEDHVKTSAYPKNNEKQHSTIND